MDQGSQQLQGEVLELAIEDGLRRAFPVDAIEEVKKGARGGDIIQRVTTRSGQVAGVLLWESKRAREWSPAWTAKLKEDMRGCGAEIGVLVSLSTAIPKEWPAGQLFGLHDDVWVTTWSAALQLAQVLRAGVLDLHKQRLVSAGKGEKMEAVYDYLTSPQFAHKLRAVYGTFRKLREELDSERSVTLQRWARREKQLQGGVAELLGMAGDIQGLAQQELPALEMEPPAPQTQEAAAPTSSVQTRKLLSVFGPKVMLMATSAASRPRRSATRPMRRASSARIEDVPLSPHVRFHPAEKSMGAGLTGTPMSPRSAGAVAGRDVQAAAQRDPGARNRGTRPRSANAWEAVLEGRAYSVAEFQAAVHEVAHRLHPRPAGRHAAEVFPRRTSPGGRYRSSGCPAGSQRLLRQGFDGNLPGVRGDRIGQAGIADHAIGEQADAPRGRDDARTPVAEAIPVHAHRHRGVAVEHVRTVQVRGPAVVHVEVQDHRRRLDALIGQVVADPDLHGLEGTVSDAACDTDEISATAKGAGR